MFNIDEIKENLKTSQIGKRIFLLDNIDSTNLESLRLINSSNAKFGDLIIAKTQSSGKGQQDNVWNSPEGGLYLSIITVSKISELSNLITFTAGIACTEAIKSAAQINVNLKWVNDIIYKRNKLGGILTQSVTRGNLSTNIIGIGINANTKNLNINNNKYNVASLLEITGNKININLLAAEICNYFEKYFKIYQQNPDEITAKWLEYSNIKECKIYFTLEGIRFSGTIEGINKSGHLIVKADEKAYTLISSRNVEIIYN
ncbi:MAG: biotin--[acetyl-CoA-carboxylase] ligase [Candidatus Gastranaerophilales bacterium]|nr:biotin--[acetyl-CoA-carboxylase] ligase [Candidatus Gastranaerophilales bacterium]